VLNSLVVSVGLAIGKLLKVSLQVRALLLLICCSHGSISMASWMSVILTCDDLPEARSPVEFTPQL